MIDLDLRIEAPAWQDGAVDIEAVVQSALAAGAAQTGKGGAVSVLLTHDEAVHVLNSTWRDKDAPTDVLSFPADEMDRPFLGDIAVAYGVCQRDATEKAIALDQHLSHLVIHGYLHLLGFDHIEDTQAQEMEAIEISALASLGWPDPYKG